MAGATPVEWIITNGGTFDRIASGDYKDNQQAKTSASPRSSGDRARDRGRWF
jgi:hypothetical protein